jgi:hypothetical protein
VSLLLLAGGCATQARRIREHADLFASLPPEVQENIRGGHVDVGYTRPMVYMAMGRPSRVYDRQIPGTNTEVWAYTDLLYVSDFRPVESAFWYRDAHGQLRLARNWDWVDVSRPVERENLRVEFLNDKVSAVERLRP